MDFHQQLKDRSAALSRKRKMELQLEPRPAVLTGKRRKKTSSISKKHFRLKDLPSEIRIMIFKLAIEFHGVTPAIVVALRGKENKDMYDEAIHILKNCTYIVHSSTYVVPFNGRTSKEKELELQKSYGMGSVARRELKHISFTFPSLHTTVWSGYVMYDFPNMRTMHFELDESKDRKEDFRSYTQTFIDFVKRWMFYPHKINKISFTIVGDLDVILGQMRKKLEVSEGVKTLVKELNAKLGKEGVATKEKKGAEEPALWVWEAEDGKTLSWNRWA